MFPIVSELVERRHRLRIARAATCHRHEAARAPVVAAHPDCGSFSTAVTRCYWRIRRRNSSCQLSTRVISRPRASPTGRTTASVRPLG